MSVCCVHELCHSLFIHGFVYIDRKHVTVIGLCVYCDLLLHSWSNELIHIRFIYIILPLMSLLKCFVVEIHVIVFLSALLWWLLSKYMTKKQTLSPHTHTYTGGVHYIWATGPLSYISGDKVDMEDFWAGALWVLKIWLYLIIGLIMMPAMFGFSLGISETYMTLLVKTLEVQYSCSYCCVPRGCACFNLCRYSDSHPLLHVRCSHECLLCVLLHSGPLWRSRRQTQTNENSKPPHLTVRQTLSSRLFWRIVVVISFMVKYGALVTDTCCAAMLDFIICFITSLGKRVAMLFPSVERRLDLPVQFRILLLSARRHISYRTTALWPLTAGFYFGWFYFGLQDCLRLAPWLGQLEIFLW